MGARTRRAALGLVVLGAQAAAIYLARGDHGLWQVVVPWLVSLVAAVVLVRPASLGREGHGLSWWWPERLIVAGVTLLAGVLRLPDLETHPSGIYGDEGEFGVLALAISRGDGPAPFGTAFLGDPALYVHILAPFVRLLGPTMEAIRLPSALVGMATVPLLYGMVRDLYGRGPALLSALLLATSAVHIHFSRLALNVVWVPFFACLSLWFLWRGMRQRGDVWYLLAGISAGLGFYFHFTARLMALVLLLVLAGHLMIEACGWRVWIRTVALTGLGALLALSPLLAHFSSNPSLFTDHMEQRGIWNHWGELADRYDTVPGDKLGILGEQVWRSFAAFLAYRDSPYGARIYTFMDVPLMNPLVGVLAMLGLALLVFHWRAEPSRLLLIWFVVPLIFASILTDVAGQAHRLINPLLPALVAAALVIDLGRRYVQVRMPARGAVVAASVVVVVPLVAGQWMTARYFEPDVTANFAAATTAQARCMEALPAGTIVLVAGTPVFADHGPSRYLGHDVDRRDLTDPETELPVDAQGRALAIMVHEEDRDVLPRIRAAYPEAESVEIYRPSDSHVLTVLAIAGEGTNARQLLSECQRNASG